MRFMYVLPRANYSRRARQVAARSASGRLRYGQGFHFGWLVHGALWLTVMVTCNCKR